MPILGGGILPRLFYSPCKYAFFNRHCEDAFRRPWQPVIASSPQGLRSNLSLRGSRSEPWQPVIASTRRCVATCHCEQSVRVRGNLSLRASPFPLWEVRTTRLLRVLTHPRNDTRGMRTRDCFVAYAPRNDSVGSHCEPTIRRAKQSHLSLIPHLC